MSAHELLGLGPLAEPPEPRPFEAARLRRVWLRTMPSDVGRSSGACENTEQARARARAQGVHLTPWEPFERILEWGVVAAFPSGLLECWSWTAEEQPPPAWIGRPPPESARLVAVGKGRRLVMELRRAGP